MKMERAARRKEKERPSYIVLVCKQHTVLYLLYEQVCLIHDLTDHYLSLLGDARRLSCMWPFVLASRPFLASIILVFWECMIVTNFVNDNTNNRFKKSLNLCR